MESNISEIYMTYGINQNNNVMENKYSKQQHIFQDIQDKTHQNPSRIKTPDNQEQNTTKLNQNTINKRELFKIVSYPIAPIRRFLGVKESSENNNKIKTVGLALLAINNPPMDLSDINSVFKQIKGKKIAPNPKQIEFTFAQDTLIEFLIKKLRNKIDHRKFDATYDKIDKSLFNTKLVQKIVKTLNIKVTKEIKPDQNIDLIKNGLKQNKIYIIKGKSKIAKLICRSLMRIPILSIVAFSLLEIPDIVKSIKNEKQKHKKLEAASKQILRSGINITTMITGMAIIGTILDRHFGALGSLIGIGIGNYLGEKIGIFINNKLFENKKEKTFS